MVTDSRKQINSKAAPPMKLVRGHKITEECSEFAILPIVFKGHRSTQHLLPKKINN